MAILFASTDSAGYLKLIEERKTFVTELEDLKSNLEIVSSGLNDMSDDILEALNLDGVSMDKGEFSSYAQSFKYYSTKLDTLISDANYEISIYKQKYNEALAREEAQREAKLRASSESSVSKSTVSISNVSKASTIKNTSTV